MSLGLEYEVDQNLDGRRTQEDVRQSADGAIAAAATKCLETSPYLSLRGVRCACVQGVLTLAGHVPSFYHRQIAQASVRGLAGVRRIDDQLQVTS